MIFPQSSLLLMFYVVFIYFSVVLGIIKLFCCPSASGIANKTVSARGTRAVSVFKNKDSVEFLSGVHTSSANTPNSHFVHILDKICPRI